MSVQKRVEKTGRVRWVARWRDKTGRERSKTFPTQRQAKQHLNEVKANTTRHQWATGTDDTITVGELFDRWTNSQPRRPASLRTYTNTRRVNLPPIAPIKAVDLSPQDVTDWFTQLQTGRDWRDGTAISETTARDALRHLRTAYNWAIQSNLVDKNPVRVPKATTPDALDVELLPTPDEIQQVIQAVRNGGIPYLDTPRGPKRRQRTCTQGPHPTVADMLTTAWLTGLRVSELCGIIVREVDLQRGVIHVRKQMDADAVKRVELKTARSRRDVPIADELVPVLLNYTLGKNPGDYLFTDGMGKPLRKSLAGVKVKRAAEHVGVETVHFHALRHVFASNLLAAGVPVHLVADVLGHSRQMLLRVYAHALPGAVDAVRDAISSSCGQNAGSAGSGAACLGR